MPEGLGRDTVLLESQELSQWRQQLAAGCLGLVTAGPLGLVGSLITFNKLEGSWLPWALIGMLAAPPLAYGQWLVLQRFTDDGSSAVNPVASQSISEADRVAQACALAIRTKAPAGTIRNPVDGSELLCDPNYPATVVVTSKPFDPLQGEAACGAATLGAGTSATQWLVSPAGTLVCQAVERTSGWWLGQETIKRRDLYRRCTENLRAEARTGFTRTAHQLGLRDYCGEERALLERDEVTASN